MAQLKRPPATVVSTTNKTNTLMTDNFKRVHKVRPRKRSNLSIDSIVVENIRNQETSKVRKIQ